MIQVGSIPHGRPTELNLVVVCLGQKVSQCSTTGVTKYTVYNMSFPVSGMVRIKTTLLLIGESNTCIAGIGFPISLSDWSLVNDL